MEGIIVPWVFLYPIQCIRLHAGLVPSIFSSGVPNEPVTLTPGIAFFIGHAFAQWLRSRAPADKGAEFVPRVSLGRDPRISGPMLEAAIVAGLASAGAEVDTFGIATTPCMFYSIIATGAWRGDRCRGGLGFVILHMMTVRL